MWLVCPITGPNTHDDPQKFLIAKAMTDWYSLIDGPKDGEDAFDSFLGQHGLCGYAGPGPYPLGTTIHFVLEYEHTD